MTELASNPGSTDPSADSGLMVDAIVVGGGPAGLSAALALGRSRRRVTVAAAGAPRNGAASAAHNILTRDGTSPAELLQIGREHLAPYDVTILEEWVTGAERISDGFAISFANGRRVMSRGLILATGVKDILPEIPGLAELWGNGVFHCPYCHGWEVRGRPLGIYARELSTERILHMCQLIRGWTDDVVLLTDGPTHLSPDDRARIQRNGVAVREERTERLVGQDGELEGAVLEGGETIALGGLIVSPDQEFRSDLAGRLGCTITEDGRVEVGLGGKTSVPGLFAAGDIVPGMQSIVGAMASGTLAGGMLNQSLLEDEFAS